MESLPRKVILWLNSKGPARDRSQRRRQREEDGVFREEGTMVHTKTWR